MATYSHLTSGCQVWSSHLSHKRLHIHSNLVVVGLTKAALPSISATHLCSTTINCKVTKSKILTIFVFYKIHNSVCVRVLMQLNLTMFYLFQGVRSRIYFMDYCTCKQFRLICGCIAYYLDITFVVLLHKNCNFA